MTDTGLDRGHLVLASRKSAVDIRTISTILLHRRFLILGVSCVVISVASVLAYKAQPTYKSSMHILVSSNFYQEEQSKNAQKNPYQNLIAPKSGIVDNTPQMRLMLNSKLIQNAVNSLRSEYPDITVEDIKGDKDQSAQQKSLVVSKIGEGRAANRDFGQIFELSFQDSDPAKAQKVLLVLKKAYEDYNVEQQKQRFAKALALIDDRLPKMRQELKQAEANLEKFRKKHNLLDPEVQGKILVQSLADIRKQLQITRAQLQDVQARHKNLEKELALVSAVNQSTLPSSSPSVPPRYQTLVNEIQKTELALDRERQRYRDDSPIIQKLIQQHQSQVELLRKEMGRSLVTSKKDTKSSQSGTSSNATLTQSIKPEALKQVLTQKTPPAQNAPQQLSEIQHKLKQQIIELQTASEGLRANEKSLAQSEQQLRSELSKYPSLISQYQRLLPEVVMNRKKLEQMTQAQQSLGLKIAQAGSDLQILETPQKAAYLGSNRFLFLFGGIIIAPILGVAAALMRESSRHIVYSPHELQRLTNLRLLATVPKLQPTRQHKQLVSLPWQWRRTSTDSKTVEIADEEPLQAYTSFPSHQNLDIAYQNIQIITSSSASKSLMLTSAIDKEGKTTLALGLALSAAQMHQRVLLVDANLRQPSLYKILNLSNDWGLSLLLVDETNNSFKDYIQPVHPSIDVLTAGSTTEDSVKLLSSQRMQELLEAFEHNYDLVLIDAPAILNMVDARILATFCKNIVMVAGLGKVTQTELIQATDILRQLNLIGVIANLASNSNV